MDSQLESSAKVFFRLVLFGFIIKLITSNESIPEQISYIGDVIFLGSLAYSYLTYFSEGKDYLLSTVVAFLFFYIVSSLWYERDAVGALKASLRIILPILLINRAMVYKSAINYFKYIRAIAFTIIITIHLLLMYGFLMLPNSMNRLVEWSPAYFNGLHNTSYVVLSSYFLFLALVWFHPKRFKLELLYLLMTFFYIDQLFGVRTALLSLIVFVLLRLSDNYKIPKSVIITFLVFLVLVFVVYFDPFGSGFQDYNHFTSGRLSMYYDKMVQLSQNSFLGWSFGNGFGSDLIITEVWWWDAKGAHNDFLTTLVENGILGFSALVMILKITYEKLTINTSDSKLLLFMFMALLVSSAGSNGIIVRPVGAYVFFWAALVLESYKEKKNG